MFRRLRIWWIERTIDLAVLSFPPSLREEAVRKYLQRLQALKDRERGDREKGNKRKESA